MQEVKIVIGFADEDQDQIGRPQRMIPVPTAPGCEVAYATIAIDRQFFYDPDTRADLARHIAEALTAKVERLIKQGPTSVEVGA